MDKENLEYCDKVIDPLREVVFEVVIADEHAAKGRYDEARYSLEKAENWLNRAKVFDPTRRVIPKYKIDLMIENINKLKKKVGEKDWKVTIDEMMPSMIRTVFTEHARCVCDRVCP